MRLQSALQTQKPVGMASSELWAMILNASRPTGAETIAAGAALATTRLSSTFLRLAFGTVLEPCRFIGIHPNRRDTRLARMLLTLPNLIMRLSGREWDAKFPLRGSRKWGLVA